MDKVNQTKHNSCKRLVEQTILITEKCNLWQHGPGIDASLFLRDNAVLTKKLYHPIDYTIASQFDGLPEFERG